jgi:hypothetical protein
MLLAGMSQDGGLILERGIKYTPQSPDHFWGVTTLLSNGYRGLVWSRGNCSELEAHMTSSSNAVVRNV